MTNFKITNITNTTGKRSMRFNSTLDIDYIDEMKKKTIKIKPGETVFLQIHSLPLSVHKLRVNKLISVIEVTNNELKNNMNIKKSIITPIVIETPKEIQAKIDTIEKKKIIAKNSEIKLESKPKIKTEAKPVES